MNQLAFLGLALTTQDPLSSFEISSDAPHSLHSISTSLQILTFNSVAPQNGHFNTIRLHKFDHLQSKDHVETATGIPISQTSIQMRTFVCFCSYLTTSIGKSQEKKAIFPRQKIIFSSRKNLLYTGARLSYTL